MVAPCFTLGPSSKLLERRHPIEDNREGSALDHDRLFKALLDTFFLDFVDLFLPDLAGYLDGGSLERLDKELFHDVGAGERLEADVVVKARFKGEATCFLVHVEHQAKADSALPDRMFRYFARLYEKHRLPVFPVALLSYTSPRREAPAAFRVAFPGREPVLAFRYEVIQLNRLDWRAYVRHENPLANALMARMAIAPEDRPLVKLQCLRLLATRKLDPARLQLLMVFVEAYMPLTPVEQQHFEAELGRLPAVERSEVVEKFTLYDLGLERGEEKGRLEGRREGRQEGRREGRQEGRQEGFLSVVMRLLERQLGALDDERKARLAALSLAELEALSDDYPGVSDVLALDAWLDRRGPSRGS